VAPVALGLLLGLAGVAHAAGEGEDLQDLSLEELMDVRVTSASNAEETLAEAPAQVIVLTRDELEQRGYRQLVDLFDDLPGMDIARPYGDNWALSYWRGFRGDVQVPFLVMVDGIVFNSLYYVDGDAPLASMPMSNIERVEVVFGPASSVYGPNAFMGVVNVITRQDLAGDGTLEHARVSVGTDGERILDATVFHKRGDFRLSLTTRVETGLLDDSNAERYEFTKQRYYDDERLWGGFVDNVNLGGEFRSPHHTLAVDGRLKWGEAEVGVQLYQLSSGLGVEYPGDKVQNAPQWIRRELSVHARHEQKLTGWLHGRLLVRYRESGIPADSAFVDGYENAPGQHVAAFSYWQARNSSWSALEDFSIEDMCGWSWHFGFKFERKDLTKAYDIHGEAGVGSGLPGAYTPVEDIEIGTYPFPEPPAAVDRPANRIFVEDVGAYVQSKYELTATQHLYLGGRIDNSTGYDIAPTLRAGYVGGFGHFGVKALYGQAFQEPPPRVLYGGWKGAGSDPDLKPERSQTFELGLSHTLAWLANSVSLYYVEDSDTISTSGAAENLGTRHVLGLDYGVTWQPDVPFMKSVQVWAWYTRLFIADEDSVDGDTTTRIGDLADNKLHFGASARYDEHLSLTLRGRAIGIRRTVVTNPVEKVDRYTTVDASAEYRDIADSGLGVSLSAQNLFDAHYFHPGIADAGAGTTPGTFEGGAYVGGSGASYFNSLMPQPGFTVMLSLWFER
jgi:outer membrane receptor protein involved in Fe transport